MHPTPRVRPLRPILTALLLAAPLVLPGAAPAAPAVERVDPETLELEPGGTATITVAGTGLDRIGVEVTEGGRPTRDLEVDVQRSSRLVKIQVTADRGAAGDYHLALAVGRTTLRVPVSVAKADARLADAARVAASYRRQGQPAERTVEMLKTRYGASVEVAARALSEAGYTARESADAMQSHYGGGQSTMALVMRVMAETGRQENEEARERVERGRESKLEAKREQLTRWERKTRRDRGGTPQAVAEAMHGAGESLAAAWDALQAQFPDLSDQEILTVLYGVFRESIETQDEDEAFWIQRLQALNATGEALAAYLHGLAVEIGTAGAWIMETLGLGTMAAADALAASGYAALDVAAWLTDTMGRSTAEVADFLLRATGWTHEQVANALAGLGHAAVDVMRWLRDTAGWSAKQIAEWAKDAYGATGAQLAAWLEALGYSATQVGAALKDAFQATGSQVAGWMSEAGFTIADIAAVLVQNFQMNMAAALQVLLDLGAAQAEATQAILDAMP